jgi:CRISPR/Cas system CSM-associated protein Csm3 (group 7 of RAMP superfamily)
MVIEGELVLQTPTHLGNGDSETVVDLPVLLDEATGRVLLPGTSIAGALRSYLRERHSGYGMKQSTKAIDALFGGDKSDDDGNQSCLIVDDALGDYPRIELRDGVRIDAKTRTAKVERRGERTRGYKFDIQLLEAGTKFDLRFELLIPDKDAQELKQTLAVALDGLARGEIMLGMRKRRGFGRCKVQDWRVEQYDLRETTGLLAWLTADRKGWQVAGKQDEGAEIATLLGADLAQVSDKRRLFQMNATFRLDGSLLIRSGFGQQERTPDVVHLHVRQADPQQGRRPVLSGTSLAGALRHRALQILQTLDNDGMGKKGGQNSGVQVGKMLNSMFGPDEIKRGERRTRASRLIVHETVVTHVNELVQNRIRIDRSTGGAFETALFNEQPVFGHDQTRVVVDLALRNPKDEEIGLLLLLLKDLWIGDLPLGGESSIGRGRLCGASATLQLGPTTWVLTQPEADGPVQIKGDREALNGFVATLTKEMKG